MWIRETDSEVRPRGVEVANNAGDNDPAEHDLVTDRGGLIGSEIGQAHTMKIEGNSDTSIVTDGH